jgi:hypothetical protein
MLPENIEVRTAVFTTIYTTFSLHLILQKIVHLFFLNGLISFSDNDFPISLFKKVKQNFIHLQNKKLIKKFT